MSHWFLQKQQDIEPLELFERPLPTQSSATAATAETFTFDIPTDHFIHAIMIAIDEHTTKVFGAGALADDIENIQLIGNGNKYIKDMIGSMNKQVGIMNKEVLSTGFYKLFATDKKIIKAKPLPAWVFTNLQLKITDNAPATSNYHNIAVSLIESVYKGQDIKNYPILIEKVLTHKHYGTNTLWQDYDHERAYEVYGYLYCMDDNGALSNTIFDKLRILARSKEREWRLKDEMLISMLREGDKIEYQNPLGTGYVCVEFPNGLPTHSFTSLKSQLNIPSAGTNAGLRVLERYCL